MTLPCKILPGVFPAETMPGYHSGINILGAGVEVTKVTLCASFCGKSLSRPSLCNLDSTPPQVITAATNDGKPCSGGQSPTSQDFAPIHHGLPELSAPFRNRPDFNSAKKARAAPNFSSPSRGNRQDPSTAVPLQGVLSD